MINTGRARDPSKRELIVVATLLGAAAAALIAHGLGIVSLDFLRPNPRLPTAVFLLAGVFLAGGACLAFMKILEADRFAIDIAGWSTAATSLILLNVIVFADPAQAACQAQAGSVVVGLTTCSFESKVLTILADTAVILGLTAWLTRALGRRHLQRRPG